MVYRVVKSAMMTKSPFSLYGTSLTFLGKIVLLIIYILNARPLLIFVLYVTSTVVVTTDQILYPEWHL